MFPRRPEWIIRMERDGVAVSTRLPRARTDLDPEQTSARRGRKTMGRLGAGSIGSAASVLDSAGCLRTPRSRGSTSRLKVGLRFVERAARADLEWVSMSA